LYFILHALHFVTTLESAKFLRTAKTANSIFCYKRNTPLLLVCGKTTLSGFRIRDRCPPGVQCTQDFPFLYLNEGGCCSVTKGRGLNLATSPAHPGLNVNKSGTHLKSKPIQ